MGYLINQEIVDKIHSHFRSKILSGPGSDVENIYITPEQKKKIKNEISRLKLIIRECQPIDVSFYEDMISFLQSKIKK
jgi:hypothetical protein